MTPEIALYCRPRCAACGALTRWLDERGVAWDMRDVTADSGAAEQVTRLGFRSLPVVEASDGRSAWGGDLDAVAALLDRRLDRPAITPAPHLQPGGAHHG